MVSSLLQVRNVPDGARRVLKARAASRGESLNAYMLALIARDVARPPLEEVLDRASRRAAGADASALDVIHAARTEREIARRP